MGDGGGGEERKRDAGWGDWLEVEVTTMVGGKGEETDGGGEREIDRWWRVR